MRTSFPPILAAAFILASTAFAADAPLRIDAPDASNPFVPGYFADPSVVESDGKFFLYATIDPWGADTLGCWESANFRDWTFRTLNWPTKQACTSPTSKTAKVWAPSVIKGRDGKFYMYVSVGSEVWAGVADAPLGPWKNALDTNRPLIPATFKTEYHMIDAEAFIDDDGTPYLYWGSGWNWVNGRCFAVKLKPDMVTFDGEVKDVTPAHYFEGPLMMKRNGKYYLMYSEGNTTKDTYEVRYAIGNSPMGPFTEAGNSPILKTDKALNVISPGHHTILRHGNDDYILYHRAAYPAQAQTNRQLCVDRLAFTPDGLIATIRPSFDGATALQIAAGYKPASQGPKPVVTASSSANASTAAEKLADNNFSTRWIPAATDTAPWVQLDLGAVQALKQITVLPEFATRAYVFEVGISQDGRQFTSLPGGGTGSPLVFGANWLKAPVRYVRITFPANTKPADAGIWEFRAE